MVTEHVCMRIEVHGDCTANGAALRANRAAPALHSVVQVASRPRGELKSTRIERVLPKSDRATLLQSAKPE